MSGIHHWEKKLLDNCIFFGFKHRFAELLALSLVLLDPVNIGWSHSKFACLKSIHIGVVLFFHLSQNLLIIIFIEKKCMYSILYWTPKLHKSPYKHRFLAGSSKCMTKDLSCLLTKVLSTIKDGLVRYCNTKTSRNGVNDMWILKNSTSLLSSLHQPDVRIQLHQSRHLIFQHFTPQSHMIF